MASRLRAVFENSSKIVIVMEYASKGDLYDYISERQRLTEQEARHFFRQVVSAVYYCHKVGWQGASHRLPGGKMEGSAPVCGSWDWERFQCLMGKLSLGWEVKGAHGRWPFPGKGLILLSGGCGSTWAQAEAVPEWLLESRLPDSASRCCRVGLSNPNGELLTPVPPRGKHPGLAAGAESQALGHPSCPLKGV